MSTPADRSRPPHPSRLRVGDQEREQAVTALGDHYAQGRLTHGEHAERLDAAWSARTRADLDLLFHDLPVTGFRPTPPPARTTRGSQGSSRSGPSPWLLVLAIVAAVVVLSEVPVVLVLLLVVAFVALKRHRRRERRLAGPPVWH